MVDPLKPFSRPITIRRPTDAKAGPTRAAASAAYQRSSEAFGSQRLADDEALRDTLVSALRGLTIQGDDQLVKAGHLFVMTVLADSFGSGVWQDPKFSELAADVLKDLLSTPSRKSFLVRELKQLTEARV